MSSTFAASVPDFNASALATAEEFVEAIRSLLANGQAGVARRAAAEGAARFPDHPWIQKANRVINPHRVVTGPAKAPDRTREFAWLREHGGQYRDQWVALLGDELLASGSDLEDVLREVRARGLEAQSLVHRVV